MYETLRCSRNVTKSFNPLPASRSLNPKPRRRPKYSPTASRSVFIAHLPAMARRVSAVHRDPLWCRSWLSRDCGDPTTRRSHRARRPDATTRWPIHGETDVLREWEYQGRRAGCDAERSIQRHWHLESRGWELWRVEILADWYFAAVHAADTQRLLRQLPRATVVRRAGRSCRERSTFPCSSRCHQARETPLHLNASPVVPAEARWHSRDSLSRCADRCWPATGKPGPQESLGESMTLTSWPQLARQQPSPASPYPENTRIEGRNATHWSRASLASDANAARLTLYKSDDVTGTQM